MLTTDRVSAAWRERSLVHLETTRFATHALLVPSVVADPTAAHRAVPELGVLRVGLRAPIVLQDLGAT